VILIHCRRDVATFVNSYPTMDVSYELVKGDYKAGEPIVLKVVLSRDADEDEDANTEQAVIAPFYPKKKMANWWIVVGEPSTRQLLSIKRVTVAKNLSVRLEFTLPQGQHSLKLSAICDSYMGADHDIPLDAIDVAEGEDSDSDTEMESDSEMKE
jgi:pre-mRNA-splicing helicase BRR2